MYLCLEIRTLLVNPYTSEGSKKQQVIRMFDNISGTYDFLNSLLSLGIDRYWRKKTLASISFNPQDELKILDIASGTGALAIQAAKAFNHANVIATDVSEKMLEIGSQKVLKHQLQDRILCQFADAEQLPFPENKFDVISAAFGVRNFENLNKGITEMHRVIKPGGQIVILEFSRPRVFPIKQLFQIYFKFILPLIGRLLSKDERAYNYLFESVQQFPDFERFTAILEASGFKNCSYKPLTFGICSIYIGYK